MSDSVQFELDADGLGVITFSRPDVRNALDGVAMAALEALTAHLTAEPALRAVVLTGADGTFISGGDVRALHGARSEEDGLAQHDLMAGALARLSGLPVPVLAAIEGAARGGGCEVALACDLRVMADDGTLGFAQIGMGVTPGWGGAERLFDLVGYARAVDLLLSGRVVGGAEALRMGLVNRLCAPGLALETALAIAGRLASGPRLAVRAIKSVLRGYATLPRDAARARERNLFGQLWASADHAEASAAFLEKREPNFRDQ